MLALIDGDIVAYQAAAKAQEAFDFGDGEVISYANKAKAETLMSVKIAEIKKAVGARRVVVVLSDDSANFRKDILPSYKRNRIDRVKPLVLKDALQFLRDKYDAIARPYLEADDVIGIIATGRTKKYPGPKVVCSTDKDMKTFPCSLYNWQKPEEGVVEIDEATADYNFYVQILMGDRVDGYDGIPGVGIVTAARILKGLEGGAARWQAIVAAYEKRGLTEEDALVQARCARILRFEDYDFDKKEPILWTPTKFY